jgi:uncharacterized membrane protein
MNGKLFKANAKVTLKRNFMTIMVVCLIAMFLGASDIQPPSSSYSWSHPNYNERTNDPEDILDIEDLDDVEDLNELEDIFDDEDTEDLEKIFDVNDVEEIKDIMHDIGKPLACVSIVVFIIIMVSVLFIIFVLSWIFYAFVSAPATVGYKRFFMNNRANAGKVSDLFSAFSKNYLNVVKVMFGTGIRIFAWSLLLIIPGIIKSYEYFFVPFILAENPEISGDKARKISSQMTDGHKMDIFILSLSFIGWYFLTCIISIILAVFTCCCCCVGYIIAFLPLAGYMACTFAELYNERRDFALANNIATESELPGFDKFIKENLVPIKPNIDTLDLDKKDTLDLNKD